MTNMTISIIFALVLVAYTHADDFCAPETPVISNYTFPPSASSPQPYSAGLRCTWTINVTAGNFVEVTVDGQLSSEDLFQLSTDGTDHQRTFSSSGESLKPSGLFRLPSGMNTITLQTKSTGSIYFNIVYKILHVDNVNRLTVASNTPGYSFSFTNSDFTAVNIQSESVTDPGVVISISDYPSSTEDMDSFFIFSGSDCYSGTFLATLRDVMIKMPFISSFSGNVTVCSTVGINTYENIMIAQEKSVMQSLTKYYVYDMRTKFKSISLMSNSADKDTSSAATFFDYYTDQSLHVYNLNTDATISFTDSTPEQAPTQQILPTQTEFYSQNNPQATFYTLFFPPNIKYSMDVEFVYTFPRCAQGSTNLSIWDNGYTFPKNSPVNGSLYHGSYNCLWKVDVVAGYYAKLFVDINLGQGDSFEVSHENGFKRTFTSNAGTNGPIFDGILYLPAGSSEIQFTSTNKGSIEFFVEWDLIPSKTAEQVTVGKSEPSTNILWSDLRSSDYMITASDNLKINLASSSIDDMDVQVLDACFVYQNGIQDSSTVLLLSQAFDTSKTVSKTAYVTCVVPVFIPGSLLTQSQENVNQYGSYRVRTTYGSTSFNLNAATGYDALTVMDIDSSKMLTLKSLSTTTNLLDIINGMPGKIPMKTTDTVPPEVQTSSIATYVLESGSASIVVDDGVLPTSAPVNQFCTPFTAINIQTSNYTFPSADPSFDGSNDCMWMFAVQIYNYGVIDIHSTLQKTDTIVITNVESGLTRQLDSKTLEMDNTFYLPVGTNIIHLQSQFNGTLSFSVYQNSMPNTGFLNNPVVKGKPAALIQLSELSYIGVYIYSINITSLVLSITQSTIIEDTKMLDSVFVFSGDYCDHIYRNPFVATLGDIYRNQVVYNYTKLSICATVSYGFNDILVVQDAEALSSYDSYAVYDFHLNPQPKSFVLDGTKGEAGISYYFYNGLYHLTVSELKGGNLSVINGSPGFPVYTSISPDVGPQPFVGSSIVEGLITLKVDKGTKATFVAGTTYVAQVCSKLTNIYNSNGFYAYPSGSHSSPAFYSGTYNCEWDVTVKEDTHALITVSGQLGVGDYFKVVHVDGTEEMINDPDKIRNISYYQSPGLSKLYFNATNRGTISLYVKYFEEGLTTIGVTGTMLTTTQMVTATRPTTATSSKTRTPSGSTSRTTSRLTQQTTTTTQFSTSPTISMRTSTSGYLTTASNSPPLSMICQPMTNITMDQSNVFTYPSGSPNYYANGLQLNCSWNVIVKNGFYAEISFTGNLPDSDIVTFTHDSIMEKLSGKFVDKQYTVPSGSTIIALNFRGNGSFSFKVNFMQEATKKTVSMTIASQDNVQSIDLSSLKSQLMRIVKDSTVKTMSLAVAVRNQSMGLSDCFVTRDDGFLLFRLSDATSVAQFVTDTVNIDCVASANDWDGSIFVQDCTDFASTFYTVAYASQTSHWSMSSLVMPEMLTLVADDDKNVVLSGMNMTGNGVLMISNGTPNTKSTTNLTSSSQVPYVSTSKYTTYTLTQGIAYLQFSTETKASATQLLTTFFMIIILKYL